MSRHPVVAMLWQSSSLVTGVVGFLSVDTAGFKSFSRRWQLLCDTKSALFRAGSMNLVPGMHGLCACTFSNEALRVRQER